jgi:hypothetical protein
MKNIEELQAAQHIGHAGAQAAYEQTCRLLLGDERAQDGCHGNQDQKNNGQLHGCEKRPDGIFFRQNDKPLYNIMGADQGSPMADSITQMGLSAIKSCHCQ